MFFEVIALLPIKNSCYKINHVNANGSSPHSHNTTSEIIQCFEQSGSILINGKLYQMKRNGLYFIHGLDTHFVAPDDLNHYSHSILHIETPEMHKLFKSLKMEREYENVFTKNGGMFCELSDSDVIKTDSVFLRIDNILKDNKPLKYARLSAALIELLEIALDSVQQTPSPNDKLNDIFSLINDNIYNKLSLDEICSKTHISKYHLCRIFKENMGITITEYIKRKRISLACQFLRDTNLKITEIAEKCGFSDSSFFTKVFVSEHSITPTQYRAKYR